MTRVETDEVEDRKVDNINEAKGWFHERSAQLVDMSPDWLRETQRRHNNQDQKWKQAVDADPQTLEGE